MSLSSPDVRIRGRALQHIRAEQLQRQPLCEPCLERGFVTEATQVDHRIPLGAPFNGKEEPSNRQSICDDCHAEKTAREFNHRPKVEVGADGWPVEGRPIAA